MSWRSSRTRPSAVRATCRTATTTALTARRTSSRGRSSRSQDCEDRIELWFEIDSERRRANSLHKLDTLITALRVFRKGLEEEFAEYDRREEELKELKGE